MSCFPPTPSLPWHPPFPSTLSLPAPSLPWHPPFPSTLPLPAPFLPWHPPFPSTLHPPALSLPCQPPHTGTFLRSLLYRSALTPGFERRRDGLKTANYRIDGGPRSRSEGMRNTTLSHTKYFNPPFHCPSLLLLLLLLLAPPPPLPHFNPQLTNSPMVALLCGVTFSRNSSA